MSEEDEVPSPLLPPRLFSLASRYSSSSFAIDFVTVSDAILTGRQTRLDIQRLNGNPMSNYFHKNFASEKFMN